MAADTKKEPEQLKLIPDDLVFEPGFNIKTLNIKLKIPKTARNIMLRQADFYIRNRQFPQRQALFL